MRNCTRFLFMVVSLFFAGKSSAQLVGTDCFLQGQFLEVGINQMGGFGTCTSPATYHPHVCCGLVPFTAGGNLDAAYDWGHDGWSVGMPALMGNYSIPGYPQEGWSIQVGATEYRNGAWGGVCTGAFAIPGGHTGYYSAGGAAVESWEGNVAGINIRQQTRLDTMASWVTVTTVLRNTTGSAIAGVWYERTLDPDNTSFWNGTPVTRNIIVHQNEDARHLVHVSANGETPASGATPAYNATNSYLALVTKDCRARGAVIGGLAPTNTPSSLWTAIPVAPSGPVTLGLLGATNLQDQGICLIYNLGTIASGDSTIISYAYVYNGDNGIDSAFPDPQIVINGIAKFSPPPPTPNYDTFDACKSGLSTIPVDILNAEDKCWSWSKWTWAPGTGLATTTGCHNIIDLMALPPIITYTITGTDSAYGMSSCNQKIFYLTIVTCNGAEANSPCVGDTLFLNAPGDSVAATYRWYGPAPSTAVFATTQAYARYPAAMSDTGTYTVIKTIAGIPDTSTVYVTIYALPVLSVTTSQVLCAPVASTMTLTCTPDSICTSFAWTGPGGFTSGVQYPVLNPFDSSMEGTYFVHAISTHGCESDGSVLVKPGPNAAFSVDPMPGCPRDSAAFLVTMADNVSTYSWAFGDGGASTDLNPMYIYVANPSGLLVYAPILTVRSANGCVKSITGSVDLKHNVTSKFETTMDIKDTVCFYNPVIIADQSTATLWSSLTPNMPLVTYDWDFDDGTTETNSTFPIEHKFANPQAYRVKLTVTDNLGCKAESTRDIVVLRPYIEAMSDSTFCLVRPLELNNVVYLEPKTPPYGAFTYKGIGFTYKWTSSDPIDDHLDSDTAKVPLFDGVGQFVYTLTATLNRHQCTVEHVTTLSSLLPTQLQNVTADAGIKYGGSIQLYADSEYTYTWTPDDGSLNNNNINNPIATPTVTTTYTVYGMDKYGCRDTAQITIRVDSTMTEHVPTGFTPNGDGLNDVFRFNGGRYQKLLEMRVYNRWGQQVFYSTTRELGWDGMFKGVPCDMGVYYYNVILARPGYPENTVYKGEITLIR